MAPIHDQEQKQPAFSHSDMTPRIARAVLLVPKTVKMIQQYVIYHDTALRSSRVKIKCGQNPNRAVSVLCRDQNTDLKTQQIVVFEVYKQLRKDNFSQQFWLKREVYTGLDVLRMLG